ncbi:MAG: hypothetical protein ACI87E_001254 [Mariniblastus sp.]|jgi:hypothetical protein
MAVGQYAQAAFSSRTKRGLVTEMDAIYFAVGSCPLQ